MIPSLDVLDAVFDDLVEKGDFVGHPFRGNQWTDSSGISQDGAGSTLLIEPTVATRGTEVSTQIDSLLSKTKIIEDAGKEFNQDHYGDYLQKVEDLGYQVDNRRNVVIDGAKTSLFDIQRTYPDHPIAKLKNDYDKSDAQRRDTYFTTVNSVFYSSFDLPDGRNVYDAAVKLAEETGYFGIYQSGGGDHVQQVIDMSVRSEADRKTQSRFVFDEGCTGPTGIGKGATGVNKALREGRVTPFARAVDASMLILNQPVAGYRGASLPQTVIDKLVVGSSYKEKGFMSVAPKRGTASFYANARQEDKLGGVNSRIVIFRMLLPAGTKADPMRLDEIVVARNSTVRVAAVREVNDPELGTVLEVDAEVEQ